MNTYSLPKQTQHLVTLLLQNNNEIKHVISNKDETEQTLIFINPISDRLFKQLKKLGYVFSADDNNYWRITHPDLDTLVLIPNTSNFIPFLKVSWKKIINWKNLAIAIPLIYLVLVLFGIERINSYLSQYNISFLSQSVFNYVGLYLIIIQNIIWLGVFFMYLLLLSPILPSKEIFTHSSLGKGKTIVWSYMLIAISNLLMVLLLITAEYNFFGVRILSIIIPLSVLLLFLSTPKIRIFVLQRICSGQKIFKGITKNDTSNVYSGAYSEFLLEQVKALALCFVSIEFTIIWLSNFHKFSNLVFCIILLALVLMVSLVSIMGILYKAMPFFEKKNWRLPEAFFLLSLTLFSCFFVLAVHILFLKINIVKTLNIGGYSEGLIVNNDLKQYPSIIKELNPNKENTHINPWVILETDKILVVTKGKHCKITRNFLNNKKEIANSCTIYYFQKNPYKLIDSITLGKTKS